MTTILSVLTSMMTTYPKTSAGINLILGGVVGHLIAQFLF